MGLESTSAARFMTDALLKSYLLHPSGGLVWHWRALRNRHRWRPMREAISRWLNSWMEGLPQTHRQLAMIGPSAGWTLPDGVFGRFDSVTIFEPDILARLRWKLQFDRQRVHFDFHDVFAQNGWQYLRENYPTHAILFCNVLGQLSPQDEQAANDWCKKLRLQLHEHPWASYHDWISTTQAPTHAGECIDFPAGTSLESALSHWWHDNTLEIHDHHTNGLANAMAFSCIPWPLCSNQWHLIQWIAHPGT